MKGVKMCPQKVVSLGGFFQEFHHEWVTNWKFTRSFHGFGGILGGWKELIAQQKTDVWISMKGEIELQDFLDR